MQWGLEGMMHEERFVVGVDEDTVLERFELDAIQRMNQRAKRGEAALFDGVDARVEAEGIQKGIHSFFSIEARLLRLGALWGQGASGEPTGRFNEHGSEGLQGDG